MDDAGAQPPPGWYVDPGDPAALRYWDGAAWSEHTAPLPSAPAVAPAVGWATPDAASQRDESPQSGVAVLAPPAAPAAPASTWRRTTLWIVALAAVAGLLVGVGGGLLSRHADSSSAPTPKAIVAAQYVPVFQRVLIDVQDINAAASAGDLAAGCTALSDDLRAGSGLPPVTREFDAVWATFLSDGTDFADGCLGVSGPAGAGSLSAALDRFTGDTNDVSVAMNRVPG